MGWFFSNLHVCKTAAFDTDGFRSALTEILISKGYVPKSNPDEADLSLSIYDAGGKWISVCSDGLDFYTEESTRDICGPLSDRLSTDVLTISCFDSDGLLLNRINRKLDIVAWLKIGSCPGLKVRSTLRKWTDIVSDAARLKAVASQKYDFAEEALDDLEPLLGLASGQGRFCIELIGEVFTETVQSLYFALPESISQSEPARLTIPAYDLMPCEIGKATIICAVNRGGRSKGLAVAFSGDYVEHEEIRFRDVQLEYAMDRSPRKTIALHLEKRQTQTGQWIYWAELPSFVLPEAVKAGLSPTKAQYEEFKREFGVRFTPEGNARKLLDITVHFIPLKNPEGQCGWCVWLHSGSKKAFIEAHNRTWGEILRKHSPVGGVKLLNADDYDIDQ